jgi:hypothetical protein
MVDLGMEKRVWSAVDLAIPWGLWAIRATGRDPKTETWWTLPKRSAKWGEMSEMP